MLYLFAMFIGLTLLPLGKFVIVLSCLDLIV